MCALWKQLFKTFERSRGRVCGVEGQSPMPFVFQSERHFWFPFTGAVGARRACCLSIAFNTYRWHGSPPRLHTHWECLRPPQSFFYRRAFDATSLRRVPRGLPGAPRRAEGTRRGKCRLLLCDPLNSHLNFATFLVIPRPSAEVRSDQPVSERAGIATAALGTGNK